MSYFLYSFAALEDEISKIDISNEIKDFILSQQDKKYQGQLFNFYKKNLQSSLEDGKKYLQSLKDYENKRIELKSSIVPDEWLEVYNNLDNEKLKRFLEINSKNNTLPKYENHFKRLFKEIELYLEKLDRIEKNSDPNIYKFEDLLRFFYLYNEKINIVLHFREESSNEEWLKVRSKSIDDLIEVANDWEKSFTKSSLTSYETNDIVYGPTWKDSSFNGHTIVELKTKNDLILEGKLLNHCVRGYFELVESGSSRIFSLRNSSNKPLVTIETSSDLIEFKQERGYKNAIPNNVQLDMIFEWKRYLHPPKDIVELFYKENFDLSNKIKALRFMDYSTQEYKDIIDEIIENYDDTDNYILIKESLSKNKYLPESYYDKIYDNFGRHILLNSHPVYDNLLEISDSISNKLFRKIFEQEYNDYSYNTSYIVAGCRKIGLEENYDFVEKLLNNNINNETFSAKNIIKLLLNNNSIKSSKIISILNSFPDENTNKIFKDEDIKEFDPKLIDNLLDSKNNVLFYKSIAAINNVHITKKILDKIAKKFNIKFYSNKQDLLEQIVKNNLNNYSLLSQFSDNPKFGKLRDNSLLNVSHDNILDTIRNYDLSTEQIYELIFSLSNVSETKRYINEVIFDILNYQNQNIIRDSVIFDEILRYISEDFWNDFIKKISLIFKKDLPDNYLKLLINHIIKNKFFINQTFLNYFLSLKISDDLIKFIDELESANKNYYILFIQALISNSYIPVEKVEFYYNKLLAINEEINPDKILYSILETSIDEIIIKNKNVSNKEIFEIINFVNARKGRVETYYNYLLQNKDLDKEIIDHIINDRFYSYNILLILGLNNVDDEQINKIFNYLLKNKYKYKNLNTQLFKIWNALEDKKFSSETLSLIKYFLNKIDVAELSATYLNRFYVKQAGYQILSNNDFLEFMNEINNFNEDEDDDSSDMNVYIIQLKDGLERNLNLTLDQCITLIQNGMKPKALINYHVKLDKTSKYVVNKIHKLANKLLEVFKNIDYIF